MRALTGRRVHLRHEGLVAQVALELEDIVRKFVGFRRVDTRRARSVVGSVPGRAAEAEVDAAGVKALERAELLGDDERSVVRAA